ncbi:mRNA turnover protein 4 homolog [Selaginella moellendorffii]|uniref:mRNA turnover protein 4 homolog n=1 Tax=Selaginella moellendorffii TaxID=88036 RepID=UPI000D1CA8ED|nr:mRNA turnover protein 4 homolog [Selaginella moellendorffii]|eukprot:XP_002967001.2 mRNA turnover protein 4 homolog [Selaginella moellendorffii]
MPKSKRNKLVTLSKTKKKGREHKESIVTAVRKASEEFRELYVFSFENMRNGKFKALRDELKSSTRFFLGSNKVLQIAIGKGPSDEVKEGIHKASEFLCGNTGMLFTNLPNEEVARIFTDFEELDFARTGSTATETVELNEGPLEQFTHEMEPFLRKQGMPVRLNRGVVELVGDYTVCREGEAISPEASRILRLLGVKMAPFRMSVLCRWSPNGFKVLKAPESQKVLQ